MLVQTGITLSMLIAFATLSTAATQSGYSRLIYAGNGKFSYEEDLLNMTHVFEDMRDSGWTPPPEMGMPPRHPNRDFSRPDER